jgi:hypothetical protein
MQYFSAHVALVFLGRRLGGLLENMRDWLGWQMICRLTFYVTRAQPTCWFVAPI